MWHETESNKTYMNIAARLELRRKAAVIAPEFCPHSLADVIAPEFCLHSLAAVASHTYTHTHTHTHTLPHTRTHSHTYRWNMYMAGIVLIGPLPGDSCKDKSTDKLWDRERKTAKSKHRMQQGILVKFAECNKSLANTLWSQTVNQKQIQANQHNSFQMTVRPAPNPCDGGLAVLTGLPPLADHGSCERMKTKQDNQTITVKTTMI